MQMSRKMRHLSCQSVLFYRILAAGILALLSIQETAGAAVYYIDAINGSDGNPGGASSPWRTLSHAQSKLSGGDTLIVRDGTYDQWTEINVGITRTQWLTIQAEEGASPVFKNGVRLTQAGSPAAEARIRFCGLTLYRDEGKWNDGALLQKHSYVEFINCTFIAEGTMSKGVSRAGVCAYDGSHHLRVEGCLFRGVNAGWEEGWRAAVDAKNSNSVTIVNNEVRHARFAVTGNGDNWLIQGNNFHDLDSDGIVFNCGDHLVINANTIRNIAAPTWYTWTGLAYYDSDTRTLTVAASEGEPLPTLYTGKESDVEVTWADGQKYVYEGRYTNTGATITFREGQGLSDADIGSPAAPVQFTVDGEREYHEDLIQFTGSGGLVTNAIISQNVLAYSARQTIFLNALYDNAFRNILIENNLIYGENSRDSSLWIQRCNGVTIRHNTMVQIWLIISDTTTNWEVRYNIIGRMGPEENAPDEIEDWNLIASWRGKADSYLMEHIGPNSVHIDVTHANLAEREGEWANPAWKALFADYESDDYRTVDKSAAVDFCLTSTVSVDLLGNPRVGAPDAGCFEVSGSFARGAPKFDQISDQHLTAGVPFVLTLSATDMDGDELTFSASGLPAGAVFQERTLTWTPTSADLGSYPVTFTVSDGTSDDSQTIMLTVERFNMGPILNRLDDKTVNENETLSFSIGATDADGDPLSYAALNLPDGASLTGQTFSWTPTYSQAGSYEVTFTASDGLAQDSQTMAISVTNVNRPPSLATIGDRSVDQDGTVTFDLSAVDPDGDSMTYSATGLPAGANLTGGTFNWTSAEAGSYEITFTASDGELVDSQTMTLVVVTVGGDQTAPVVARYSPAPDAIQVPLNNLVTLHITDAGKGVDADSVTIAVDDNVIYQGDKDTYTSAYGQCSRSGTKNDYMFVYQPNEMFDFDHVVTVRASAADLAGNVMNEYVYSFATEMRVFAGNKQVSRNAGSANKRRPVTVRDAAGNIWTAWHAGPEGSRDVYIARLVVGADAFDSPTRLTTDPGDQCNPDVAAAADGSLYVVWQDNRRDHWDVYASVCSDGEKFSREVRVSDSNDNEIGPVIAIDRESPSRVHVAWQDGRNGNQDIYVATTTNAFASTTISPVTTDAADQTEPAISVDGQNTVYIVWTDMRNGQADIYGAASNRGPWTNVPIATSADAQTEPALATEPGRSVLHLVWVDDTPGDRDIYYAKLDGLPGNPVAGGSIIDDTSGADQVAPDIMCSEQGKIFACWEDSRHMGIYGSDSDLYLVELSEGTVRTNVLVGDEGTNANQSEPALGVGSYGEPYVVWVDDRSTAPEIYYAATTFIDPEPLDARMITASVGGTVGTAPEAISELEDVSIVVPPGACQTNLRMTISRIVNPQVSPIDCLGSYDFGPSGIDFDPPVTVTIPYRFSGGGRARAYWYDSLTGAMSQQGITDIENITLSSNLSALRFKTTHFTPFYLVAGEADVDSSWGFSGGCSLSPTGDGSPEQLLVPYAAIAAAMAILRRRDRRVLQSTLGSRT